MVNLNIIDVLMAAIFAICIIKGRKAGLVPGLINVIGVLFATVIALHYYNGT